MAKPVITLARAKSHLRVAHDLDDELIELLADAAVDRTLQEIGLAGELTAGTRETPMETRAVKLPLPVLSVSSVSKDGVAIDAADWELSGNPDLGQTVTVSDAVWDAASEWEIVWEAGYATVPSWFTVAALFLLCHYYVNRGSVVVGQGIGAMELPNGWKHLCEPHRRVWFA